MIDFNRISIPTMLLNKGKTLRNIQRMSSKAAAQGVRFRPHFKTHQSTVIGEWFRSYGTQAITVSSVEMAQYFAANGWKDITIAFSMNWRQIEEVNHLAEQIHLGILVESAETVEFLKDNLSAEVDTWVKIDSGAHRTGIRWEQTPQVSGLVEQILKVPNLRIRGLLTHAGHTYHVESQDSIREAYAKSVAGMFQLRESLQKQGLPHLEISVGDTPGCTLSESLGGVDEIRAGNFVFYDAMQASMGTCGTQDIAMSLACPVVAKHADRQEVIVYGGAIHLSKDYFVEDGVTKYGYVCFPDAECGWGEAIPGAYVCGLSQEHGVVRFPSGGFDRVRVGDLLCILPAHSCLVVTQLHRYLSLDGEVIPTFHACA